MFLYLLFSYPQLLDCFCFLTFPVSYAKEKVKENFALRAIFLFQKVESELISKMFESWSCKFMFLFTALEENEARVLRDAIESFNWNLIRRIPKGKNTFYDLISINDCVLNILFLVFFRKSLQFLCHHFAGTAPWNSKQCHSIFDALNIYFPLK